MKRVADPGAHRRAAALPDDLGHGLRADEVVDDRGARAPGRASRWPRSPWSASPTGARPARRRGRPGRRRRRRPGRRRRRSRAPGPAGPAGSRAGSGRPGGSGRCRRARGTGSRGRTGRPSNTAGTTRPPMPLAVSATTFSGRSELDVDERAHVVGEARSSTSSCVRRRRWSPPAGRRPRRHRPDVAQPGVLADRPGARAGTA